MKMDKSVFYIAFLACFFVFLMGGINVCVLQGATLMDRYYAFASYSFEQFQISIMQLVVALCAMNVGYVGAVAISDQYKGRGRNKLQKENDNPYIWRIALLVFFITWIAAVIVAGEKVAYTLSHSYVELYSGFATQLPLMVHKLAQLNTICGFIVLCTVSSRKISVITLALYCIPNILGIVGGERMAACVAVLIVLMYVVFRHYHDKTGWIRRWHMVVAACLLPVVMIGLNLVNWLRNDMAISDFNPFNELGSSFVNIGGSFNVLGLVQIHELHLPDTNYCYTLGPVIEYVQSGTIARFLGGRAPYTGMDAALYANNLGATISYLVLGEGSYLAGNGLGTCYLAELWVDFGFAGIIVFSILLGMVFQCASFRTTRWWPVNALICYCMRYVLIMPRSFAMDWLPNLLSPYNIMSLVGIWVLALAAQKWMVKKHANR